MKEGNSSPIQESISNPEKGLEELIKSLKLRIRITPIPDNPQSVMSYSTTIAGASTVASPGKTGPLSTTDSTGGVLNWSASSRGHQIIQGSTVAKLETLALDKEP